jgi:hypothetical protein
MYGRKAAASEAEDLRKKMGRVWSEKDLRAIEGGGEGAEIIRGTT